MSNDNYKVSSDITSVPFSIDKRELVLNWSGTETVYNTQEQCPEVEVENFAGEDTCTATVTGAQTECGEYEVTAEISGLDESKYVLPETLTHSFKILPAEAGLEILPVTQKTFGDDSFTLETVKATDSSEIAYSVSDESVITVDENGTVTIVGAGTAVIKAETAATKNYKAGEHTLTPFVENEKRYVVTEAKEGVLTIERAPQVFTVLNNEFTYGDSDNARLMRTNSKQTVSYAYKDGERTDVVELDAFGNIKPLRAGNTVIVAAAAETKNWLPGYMEIPVTVAPITVKFDWSGTSYTYDGAEHIPQLTVTGMINGDKCDAVLSGAETNAGSYTASNTS